MNFSFITVSLILSIVVAAVFFSCKKDPHHEDHWSYTGKTGPAHWCNLKPEFSACKDGKAQSPINITGPIAKTNEKIKFDYSSSPLKVTNNGHSIQVDYSGDSSITVKNKKFKLLQFHFHCPSEGAIEGKHFDMCAHLVHKSDNGELAVVAVYFETSKENSFIKTVWDNMPNAKNKENVVENVKIDVNQMLPENRAFYSYMGSLTTPPCTEGVHWYVLSNPVNVSEGQVKRFTSIFPLSVRPLQELNNRKIFQGQ